MLLSPVRAKLSAEQDPNISLLFSSPVTATVVSVFQAGRMVESKISHDEEGRLHSQQLRSKSEYPGNRRVSSPAL